MVKTSDDIESVVGALNDGASFLVLTHTNPDGDAIGSIQAMSLALRRMGKQAVAFTRDDPPYIVRYLPEMNAIARALPDPAAFDTVVVMDCGDFERVGKETLGHVKDHPNVINIDHHASNPMFGRINLVDESASSTCEMAHRILSAWGFEFDADVATCVYTGVFSDTRAFHNANSTPASFRVCADMVAAGAKPAPIAQHLYVEQRAEQVRLLGMALATLAVEDDGRIAGVSVTQDMTVAAGATQADFEGLVDVPRAIVGVEGAYLVREVRGPGGAVRVKGSVRTSELIDATVVTGYFGGGGHRRAAGFTTDGRLDEIRAALISRLREQLNHS